VFELTKIFGPKREEVTGSWIKLNNEELHIVLDRIDKQGM
jgi:hypothetical protein